LGKREVRGGGEGEEKGNMEGGEGGGDCGVVGVKGGWGGK